MTVSREYERGVQRVHRTPGPGLGGPEDPMLMYSISRLVVVIFFSTQLVVIHQVRLGEILVKKLFLFIYFLFFGLHLLSRQNFSLRP